MTRRRTGPVNTHPGPPVAQVPLVEWAPGMTPCRAVPALFDDRTSRVARAQAKHLCLTHCPKLDTCRADRATADPVAIASVVFAGRMTTPKGRDVTIPGLPRAECPTHACGVS